MPSLFHDPHPRPEHGPSIAFHPPAGLLFATLSPAIGAHHRSPHLPPLLAHHHGVSHAAGRAVHLSGLGRIASRFGLTSELRSLLNRLIEKVVAAFEGL
jgi:hypothetical protein